MLTHDCQFRPTYGGPTCGDHFCGINIRIGSQSARCADESLFIPDSALATLSAGLRAVGRIDLDHRDPFHRRLVANVVSKLEEAPERDHPVKTSARNFEPSADSFQIFEGNHGASRLDCFLHNSLGNVVIGPGGPTPLQAGEPAKDSFSPARPFALEAGADAPPELSIFSDFFAVEFPARAGSSDVSDAKIDTKHTARMSLLDFGFHYDISKESFLGSY